MLLRKDVPGLRERERGREGEREENIVEARKIRREKRRRVVGR